MGLRNKNSIYDFNGNYIVNSEYQIAQAERRLAAKKQALEDTQNEFNLIENQAFMIYVNNIDYFELDQKSFIKECKDWLNMQKTKIDKDGNKLDGRKSYKEKDLYNWYINNIKKILDIKDMEDIKFIDYNFGEATIIQFTYCGKEWELSIPHVKTMNIKSYQRYGADVFKLKISVQDSSVSWNRVGSTYEEDELKQIMLDGIKKYCEV